LPAKAIVFGCEPFITNLLHTATALPNRRLVIQISIFAFFDK
jgi:hypothetical protein